MLRGALIFLLVVIIAAGALMLLRTNRPVIPKDFKPRPVEEDEKDDW